MPEEPKLRERPDPYDDRFPSPRDTLSWSPEERILGLRNTWRMYPGTVFTPSSTVKWEYGSPIKLSYNFKGENKNLSDYVVSQHAGGLILLHKGKIVHEYYGFGNTPSTLWTSRSVAKSICSILLGCAIKDGLMSYSDPITKYVPQLIGSAWDGCTINHVATHTSGVDWIEDYTKPGPFADMTLYEAEDNTFDKVLNLVANLKRAYQPGTHWAYCSGGSFVLGLAIEQAVKMSLGKYLELKLWGPMESQGVWQNYAEGSHDIGAHGFNATLRDYARFAYLTASNNLPVEQDWVEFSTRPTAQSNNLFSNQWWNDLNIKGTFWAKGIFGQHIAINRETDKVLVQWSAYEDALDRKYDEEASAMFAAFVDQ